MAFGLDHDVRGQSQPMQSQLYLGAVEYQLARPFQDPLAAVSNSICCEGLACQLVKGAAHDPLHLPHPQLHRPRHAGVHRLHPCDLLACVLKVNEVGEKLWQLGYSGSNTGDTAMLDCSTPCNEDCASFV